MSTIIVETKVSKYDTDNRKQEVLKSTWAESYELLDVHQFEASDTARHFALDEDAVCVVIISSTRPVNVTLRDDGNVTRAFNVLGTMVLSLDADYDNADAWNRISFTALDDYSDPPPHVQFILASRIPPESD